MDFSSEIKFFIFDFDQTIAKLDIDWTEWQIGTGKIFKKYEPSFTLHEQGKAVHMFQNTMFKKYGVELKKEVDNYVRDYEEKHTKRVIPVEKTIALINKLYDQGQKLYIWSSNDTKTVHKYLGQLNIYTKFKLIVTRDIVDSIKPESSGFTQYFSLLDTNKNAFVLIGDSEFDKQAAAASGIKYSDVKNI